MSSTPTEMMRIAKLSTGARRIGYAHAVLRSLPVFGDVVALSFWGRYCPR